MDPANPMVDAVAPTSRGQATGRDYKFIELEPQHHRAEGSAMLPASPTADVSAPASQGMAVGRVLSTLERVPASESSPGRAQHRIQRELVAASLMKVQGRVDELATLTQAVIASTIDVTDP